MNAHKTIEDVKKALDALKELLSHDCVKNLEVSESFSIKNDYAGKSFPNAADAGVYIFTDDKGYVLYIGKASSGLGQRIGNEYIGRGGALKGTKISEATELHTIRMEPNFSFMAPAIEEYLIGEICPPNNKVGIGSRTRRGNPAGEA